MKLRITLAVKKSSSSKSDAKQSGMDINAIQKVISLVLLGLGKMVEVTP